MTNYDDITHFRNFTIQCEKWKEKHDDVFLIDFRIKKYDLLMIQKLWRNVCVFTFYNSFNINFYLLYENSRNVKICFYVNIRLHVDH
jgi:hypothetical protein